MIRSLVCCLILITATPSALADSVFEIGDFGTKLTLGRGWEVDTAIQKSGVQHAFRRRGLRLMVVGSETSLPPSVAATELYESFAVEFRAEGVFNYCDLGAGRAREWPERFALEGHGKGREFGIAFVMRLVTVSEPGLVHAAILVAPLAQEEEMIDLCRTLPKRLTFPDEDAEWRTRLVEETRPLEFDWGDLSIRYAPALWEDDEIEGSPFAVEAGDDTTTFYLFENRGKQFEVAAKEHAEFLAGDGGEVREREREFGGVIGREFTVLEQNGTTYRSLYLPVADRVALELRLFSPRSNELTGPIWEDWLRRVDLHFVEAELPELPYSGGSDAAPGVAPLGAKPWLAGSTWIGTAPNVEVRGVAWESARPDDYLVYGRGGAERVHVSEPADWVYPATNVTLDAGRCFLIGGEPRYRFGDWIYERNGEGDWTELPGRPFIIAPLVDGEVRVHRAPRERLPGFESYYASGPERYVVDGSDEASWSDPVDSRTMWLVPSLDRDVLFRARTSVPIHGTESESDLLDCAAFRSAGEGESLGRWNVRHVGPAAGGWIVTGAPAGGDMGIYLVSAGEKARLLVSGWQFVGVHADASAVVLAGSPYLPAQGESSGTALYRVSRETLAEHGPLTQPFSPSRVNAIGARLLDSIEGAPASLFASEASIRAAADTMRVDARTQAGTSLPRGEAEIDRAFQDWMREGRRFDSAGRVVLMILLCEAWLDGGAEWVPADPSLRFVPRTDRWTRSNCYAMTRMPNRVLESTLFDEDGYYRPLAEIQRQLEGRRLLIGLDAGRLEARADEEPEDTLWNLIEAEDPEALVAHVGERSGNVYLRYEVYLHLSARLRSEAMARVARPFLTAPDPLFMDARAWVSSQLASREVVDWEPVLDQCKRALETYPRAPALHFLLGEIYRRRGEEGDARLARVCFQRVAKLTDKGDVLEDANKALEQLKSKSGSQR